MDWFADSRRLCKFVNCLCPLNREENTTRGITGVCELTLTSSHRMLPQPYDAQNNCATPGSPSDYKNQTRD